MTPREIALLICEPWFNGDPCEGCECHKVCTKLVERIEAAIQAERAPETNFGNMAQAVDSKESDHIRDATEIVASVREDRTIEPVGYGVFEDGNLHDSFRLEHEAKLFAAYKGEHAEVKALYTAPPKREPLTEEEITDLWDEQSFHLTDRHSVIDFVRDIERAHGIGGGE